MGLHGRKNAKTGLVLKRSIWGHLQKWSHFVTKVGGLVRNADECRLSWFGKLKKPLHPYKSKVFKNLAFDIIAMNMEVAGYVKSVSVTRMLVIVKLDGHDKEFKISKPVKLARTSAENTVWDETRGDVPDACFILIGVRLHLKQNPETHYKYDMLDYNWRQNDVRHAVSALKSMFSKKCGFLYEYVPSNVDLRDLLREFTPKTAYLPTCIQEFHDHAKVCLNGGDGDDDFLQALKDAATTLRRIEGLFQFKGDITYDMREKGVNGDQVQVDDIVKNCVIHGMTYDDLKNRDSKKSPSCHLGNYKRRVNDLNIETAKWTLLERLALKSGASQADCDAEYLDTAIGQYLSKFKHMCIHRDDIPSILKKQDRRARCMQVVDKSPLFRCMADGFVFLLSDFELEKSTADHIKRLQSFATVRSHVVEDLCFENKTLVAAQKQVVNVVVKQDEKFVVVVGFPGSGKTTVVRELVLQYMKNVAESGILVLAYTGKAVDRIRKELNGKNGETTLNVPTSTIDSAVYPGRDRATKVSKAGLVIVDEMSLVDSVHFYQILKNCRNGTNVVVLGDNDQLASIARGDVLSELVASSHCFPVIRMTKVHRQTEDSSISKLACHVREKTPIPDNLLNNKDVTWIDTDDPAKIMNEVMKLYNDTSNDHNHLQILTPSNTSVVGTNSLNILVHRMIFDDEANNLVVDELASMLRPGDLCIVQRNDYEAGYFNGQVGVACRDYRCNKCMYVTDTQQRRLSGEENNLELRCTKCNLKEAVVELPWGNTVPICIHGEKKCTFVKLADLTMSYAISVHKSQGSEYDKVALVLHHSMYTGLMTRELVYTAITRAKRKLYILASRKVLTTALNNDRKRRNTKLSDFLMENK